MLTGEEIGAILVILVGGMIIPIVILLSTIMFDLVLIFYVLLTRLKNKIADK